MLATAEDLPPEMLGNIAEILSGKFIETFNDGADSHPLELSKRELSARALTCRYWAKLLRPKLFTELILSTSEDAKMFQSCIIAPHRADMDIARHVRRLMLRYNVTHSPWLHLVFLCRGPLTHLRLVKVCLLGGVDAMNVTLRSVHQGLPRSFPPSLSYINTLELQGLTFPTFSDLSSTLRSAPVLFVTPGLMEMPSQSYAPVMPGNIILQSIRVTSPDQLPHLRPFELRLNDNIMFHIQDCLFPWQFLRALVPTQPRVTSKRWYPFVQPQALYALERLSSAIIQTCPTYRDKEDVAAVESHSHPRAFHFEFRHGKPPSVCASQNITHYIATELTNHGFTLYIREWCDVGGVEEVRATIAEGGLLSRVDITISHHERARTTPWRDIDEDLWALIPTLGAFVLEMWSGNIGVNSERRQIVVATVPEL